MSRPYINDIFSRHEQQMRRGLASHSTAGLSSVDLDDIGLYGRPVDSSSLPSLGTQFPPPQLSSLSVSSSWHQRGNDEHQPDKGFESAKQISAATSSDFKALMDRFLSRNKEHMDNWDSSSTIGRNRQVKLFSEDDFMPPLDSMMSLRTSRLQRDRFFHEVEIGDVFCCSVLSVTGSGLDMVLLCYACKRNREIDQLKVLGSCSSRDIPELLYGESKEVSDVFSVKDKVIGVVIGLSQHNEKIQLSLLQRDLPRRIEDKIQLGLIRSEDLPSTYRTMCVSDDLSYSQILHSNPMFSSPGATHRLCQQLNIKDDIRSCSFYKTVSSEVIESDEMAPALRKKQSRIHALHSVVKGVKLYKDGKHTEALSLYNKALEIDGENVEALVARGAMYASNESYQKALEDFKQALKLNPEHQNARDYMVQTLLAYGRDLEDIEEVNSAVKCYKELLALDPNNNLAREALMALSATKSFCQEPVVSSTRPDTTSPAYSSRARSTERKRRSRDSPVSTRRSLEEPASDDRRLSGYSDRSLERRRRSIISDGHSSGQNLQNLDHNKERIVGKYDGITSRSSSNSSSRSGSSTTRRRHKQSTKRRGGRRSSSSDSGSDRKTKIRSRRHLRSSTRSSSRSVSARRKSSVRKSSGKGARESQDQPSAKESLNKPRTSSTEGRFHNSERRSISRDKQGRHRRRRRSSSSDSRSDKRLKKRSRRHSSSSSRSSSRSVSARRKSSIRKSSGKATHESQDQSSTKARDSSDKPRTSSTKGRSHSSERHSFFRDKPDKQEEVDRYGLAKRDSSNLDIFSDLTEPKANPTSAESKQPATSVVFLPYCLSTDPSAMKKHMVKPFNIKKPTGVGNKTLANFLVKAQKGKRKAIITASVHSPPDSKSVQKTPPSFNHTSVNMPSKPTEYASTKSRSRSKQRHRSSSTSRSRSHSIPRSHSKSHQKSKSHHRSHSRSHRSHSRSKSRCRSRSRSRSKPHSTKKLSKQKGRTSRSKKKTKPESHDDPKVIQESNPEPSISRPDDTGIPSSKVKPKSAIKKSKISPGKKQKSSTSKHKKTPLPKTGAKKISALSLASAHLEKGNQEEIERTKKLQETKIKLADKSSKQEKIEQERKLQQMEDFLSMLKGKKSDK